MPLPAQTEQHIEVHKFQPGAIVGTAFLALVLQGFVVKYFARAEGIIELPFLVTLYFGLSRRNPSTGLLLGMAIGLAQDAISREFIGLFGIAKTLVGYASSSVGARLDVDHPLSRLLLGFVFFGLHQGAVELVRRWLLDRPQPFFTAELGIAAAANAVLAVALFTLLDRLRRS